MQLKVESMLPILLVAFSITMPGAVAQGLQNWESNQQTKINQDASNGILNQNQVNNLSDREAQIQAQEQRDMARNGGSLTPQEQNKIGHELGNVNNNIARDASNNGYAQQGWQNGNARQGWQNGNAQQGWQNGNAQQGWQNGNAQQEWQNGHPGRQWQNANGNGQPGYQNVNANGQGQWPGNSNGYPQQQWRNGNTNWQNQSQYAQAQNPNYDQSQGQGGYRHHRHSGQGGQGGQWLGNSAHSWF